MRHGRSTRRNHAATGSRPLSPAAKLCKSVRASWCCAHRHRDPHTPSCSCATVQQVERAEGSCTRHTQRDHGRREQLRLDESMAMACVVGAVQTNSAARAIGSCHRLAISRPPPTPCSLSASLDHRSGPSHGAARAHRALDFPFEGGARAGEAHRTAGTVAQALPEGAAQGRQLVRHAGRLRWLLVGQLRVPLLPLLLSVRGERRAVPAGRAYGGTRKGTFARRSAWAGREEGAGSLSRCGPSVESRLGRRGGACTPRVRSERDAVTL